MADRIVAASLALMTILGIVSFSAIHSSSAYNLAAAWQLSLRHDLSEEDLAMYGNATDSTKPVADAGKDRSVRVGHEITLDARKSTDDVGIVNYTWSFVAGPGPGTLHRLYGQVVHFTFEEAREYQVVLSVSDAAGNVDYDEIVVTAEKPADIGSVLFSGGVLLALGVVLVLVAVLLIEELARLRGEASSASKTRKRPPSTKK